MVSLINPHYCEIMLARSDTLDHHKHGHMYHYYIWQYSQACSMVMNEWDNV